MNAIKGVMIAIIAIMLTTFMWQNNHFVILTFGTFPPYEVWLPLLVLGCFALGFLPMWLWTLVERMRLRRQITKLEASLARTETDLAQAQVERLHTPVAVVHPAPPPGT